MFVGAILGIILDQFDLHFYSYLWWWGFFIWGMVVCGIIITLTRLEAVSKFKGGSLDA